METTNKNGYDIATAWAELVWQWRFGLPGRLVSLNLRDANFNEANLANMDAWNTDFSGANLRKVMAPVLRAQAGRFCGVDAIEGIFFAAQLDVSDWWGAVADGSDFRVAALCHANMLDATFSWAKFDHANLIRANLSRADCNNASFVGARLERSFCYMTSFRRANLRKADFRDAYLVRADFTGAVFDGVLFHGADTRGAIGIPDCYQTHLEPS